MPAPKAEGVLLEKLVSAFAVESVDRAMKTLIKARTSIFFFKIIVPPFSLNTYAGYG